MCLDGHEMFNISNKLTLRRGKKQLERYDFLKLCYSNEHPKSRLLINQQMNSIKLFSGMDIKNIF